MADCKDTQRLIERLREESEEVAEMRRSLDNIKVRAYELGQRELHDMALAALKGERR